MSHTPPVPQASQSPFPIQEPAHPVTTSAASTTAAGSDAISQGVTAAQDAVGPLVEKARAFAKDRPFATAALVGTIALAVLNTLRGRRAG